MRLDLQTKVIGGLAIVAASIAGLAWALSASPAPPAAATALKEVHSRRMEVRAVMDELLDHEARAKAALASDRSDRALAHLLVLSELAEEMRAEHLKLPSAPLDAFQEALGKAVAATRAGDAGAAHLVDAIRIDCIRCHQEKQGPRFGAVDGPPVPETKVR